MLKQRLLALGFTGLVLGSSVFIGAREGLVLRPYTDIGDVKTWCYGQTVGTPKTRYTAQECAQDLAETVQGYWDRIAPYVPQKAPQSVKEAMVSVAYNVGVAGWKHPVFLKPLAAHDWEATCRAIVAPWRGKHGVAQGFKATVRGKPSRGLENRRWDEFKLCMEDVR